MCRRRLPHDLGPASCALSRQSLQETQTLNPDGPPSAGTPRAQQVEGAMQFKSS
jgi:hypothetical protein